MSSQKKQKQEAVRLLKQGKGLEEIVQEFPDLSKQTVAALKAHITMGTYKENHDKGKRKISKEALIELLSMGFPDEFILSTYMGLKPSNLHAYKAHITMGTYDWLGKERKIPEEELEWARKQAGKKSKEELLKEAREYEETQPGYTNDLGERNNRHDNKAQEDRIKEIEDYSCQICGFTLPYINGDGNLKYSIEAAHIIPKSEGGDESLENIIISCYNCHKKIDLCVIKIDIKDKTITENEKPITLHHDYHLFVEGE